jgi:putative endonuclease
MSGYRSYRAGLEAEGAVERLYLRQGAQLADRRWRGRAGEIDLVMRQGASVVFIEVKHASTHAAAAERLGAAQRARIFTAASEFLAGEPAGQLTECRFDVALVDGVGRIEVVENAFAA